MKNLMIRSSQSPVLSHLSIRKAIGILGITLPFVVSIGAVLLSDCSGLQPSISDYYHTVMRNIFVGILCAVALFLFTYHGFDDRDKISAKIAAIMALGIAFFPTGFDGLVKGCTIEPVFELSWASTVHIICAATFFAILAYFSLFLFTKSSFTVENKNNQFTILFGNDLFNREYTKKLSRRKKCRNRIYIFCGFIILLSLILMAIYLWFVKGVFAGLDGIKPVFWLEAIALWAFGISWLTKGQWICGN
jgi:hypothetical protein